MVNISRAEQLKTKPTYWKQQADIWQETDLTQSEYCWQHNLKDNQLTYVGYLPEVAGDGDCFSTLLTPIQCLRLQSSSPKKNAISTRKGGL